VNRGLLQLVADSWRNVARDVVDAKEETEDICSIAVSNYSSLLQFLTPLRAAHAHTPTDLKELGRAQD
jgi:hypothetical protein